MLRILFACTGNTCRSPMAQALMHKILRERGIDEGSIVEILSAGLNAVNGFKAACEAAEVMQQISVDISGHSARQIEPHIINDCDIILTMTEGQAALLKREYPYKSADVFVLSQYVGEDGDVPDPYGRGIESYRDTLRMLDKLLNKLAQKIVDKTVSGGC